MTIYDDKQQCITTNTVKETYFMGIIIISQLAKSINVTNGLDLALVSNYYSYHSLLNRQHSITS